MKSFTIASIVALATVASAQLDNIPQCALSCFVGPLTSDGCESLTDFECHCKKGDTLLASVQPCVEGACSAEDQAAAISAVESTCKAAGVPITIPDSSASPSEVSSAAETVTSVISSAVETVTSVASSVAEETSSMMMTSSMDMSSSITPVPMPTVSGTDAVSLTPTASSSMSEFTGAAAQATHAAGVLGAAALALLAL